MVAPARPLVRSVRTVVHATDFSPASADALAVAQAYALQLGARLDLLHVSPAPGGAEVGAELDRMARQMSPALPVTKVIRYGRPADTIVSYAEHRNADMIVLGTHGHTGASRVLLGSVAEKVARMSRCPVVTVPPSSRVLGDEYAGGGRLGRCVSCGMRSEDLLCAACTARFRMMERPPPVIAPEQGVAGEMTPDQIEQLLRREVLGRLGCHADGRTYIVPLAYVYDDHAIYFRSGDGKKIRMMRENPNVCFQVDHVKDLADWQSVIAWGTFEELRREEAFQGLQRLTTRFGAPPEEQRPGPPDRGGDERLGHRAHAGTREHVIGRIRVLETTGRFEQR